MRIFGIIRKSFNIIRGDDNLGKALYCRIADIMWTNEFSD